MLKDNRFYILLGIIVISGLLYLLSPILTPFLLGGLFAYIANPLVKKLRRLGIPNIFSVIIVFLLFVLIFVSLILLFIPIIQRQINTLIDIIPNIVDWLQGTIVPWIQQNFGVNDQLINGGDLKKMLADNLTKTNGATTWVVQTVLVSSAKLIEWIIALILIPVVMFYLLWDWDQFLRGIRNLLPRHIEPTVVKLAKECDNVLSAFFRGQLLIMIILAFVYSIGLSLVGLQVGIIIGTISGLLSIVPYLGFITGIIAASIAAYIQSGTMMSVVSVMVIYGIVHILEIFVLIPQIMGNKIGLHPVAVIFAILAGGLLFGFLGILLALPTAAIIMVLVRHAHKKYRKSDLYQA